MLAGWFGRGLGVALGVTFAVSLTATSPAQAARNKPRISSAHAAAAIHSGMSRAHSGYASRGRSSGRRWGSVLQCVPFARENSGIELSGNAGTWWSNAEGLYERGAKPEVGSILNFRSTGRMRMGHVAVVTNVINSRHIEIDHANWGGPGRVSRDMDVVDVSPSNDWTAVRVALDHFDDNFGSVYPTYGFIYDRPDRGVMVANAGVSATPVLNAATADLRPASDRIAQPLAATAPEEVAEAEDDTAPRGTHRRGGRSSHASIARHGHSTPHASLYRVTTRSATPAARPHHGRRRF